jgi:uncharacterized membrane protein
MEILLWILLWWLIGIVTCVLFSKYNEGELLVKDLILAFCIGLFGPIVTLVVCVYKINTIIERYKDKKIW